MQCTGSRSSVLAEFSIVVFYNDFLTDTCITYKQINSPFLLCYSWNLLLSGVRYRFLQQRPHKYTFMFRNLGVNCMAILTYDLRYKRSMIQNVPCFKRSYPDEKLPPYFNSPKQHIKQANYSATVRRRSLECNPTIPDRIAYRWSEDENGIHILWNECFPAPNEVRYLLSCGCTRKCEVGTCFCLDKLLSH